ncbi:SPOR domain-containing protein [Desulfovibrio inopinatus]|uniref:SPOR domain-containing protein n=1 Tax=Desulfovibrio inopinatus TaxID=102109 RepID=UPI00041B90A0|nr:SPOR domain-containing protein [Desulfovibrio inopinatus]
MPTLVFNQERAGVKSGLGGLCAVCAVFIGLLCFGGCSIIQEELTPSPKPAATPQRDITSLSDLRRDVGNFQTLPADSRQCECNRALLQELEDLVSDRQNTVLAISEVVDNVKSQKLTWRSSCRGNTVCPDSAYTIIYKRIPVDRLERDRLPFRTDFIRGVKGRSQKAKTCNAMDNLASALINDVATAKANKEFFLLFRVQELGKQSIPGVELITATMPIPVWTSLESGVSRTEQNPPAALPEDQVLEHATPSYGIAEDAGDSRQTQSSSTERYTVVFQLAALGTQDAANRYVRMLRRDGFVPVVEPVEVESTTLYRILVTVSGTNDEIDQKMKKTGVLDPIVRSRTKLNPA